MYDQAVGFVRSFVESRKPIGVICNGPWTLVEADVVRGRTPTSFPSCCTDLDSARATWVDREVVADNGLVSSGGARPRDLKMPLNARSSGPIAIGDRAPGDPLLPRGRGRGPDREARPALESTRVSTRHDVTDPGSSRNSPER
jgi:hypothetical protein